MINVTDSICLISVLFLVWLGFSRGFLNSIIGPLALIVGSVVALVYYALTKNMLQSLCIGLFLPILLHWILKLTLRTWQQLRNKDIQLSFISRLSGALLTLIWGMTIIIITLLLLAMMPPINRPLEAMFKDIHNSRFYKMIRPLEGKTEDSKSGEDNIKALSEDKRIQDIINDPVIVEAINNKDYAALINNPKITAIMQDPELLKKMLSLYKEIGKDYLPPAQ